VSAAGSLADAGDPARTRLLPVRRTTYRVVRGRLVAVPRHATFQPVDPQLGARLIAGLRSLHDPAAALGHGDSVRAQRLASSRHRVAAGGENDPGISPTAP